MDYLNSLHVFQDQWVNDCSSSIPIKRVSTVKEVEDFISSLEHQGPGMSHVHAVVPTQTHTPNTVFTDASASPSGWSTDGTPEPSNHTHDNSHVLDDATGELLSRSQQTSTKPSSLRRFEPMPMATLGE